VPVLSCVDARLPEVGGFGRVVFESRRVSQSREERRGGSADVEKLKQMSTEKNEARG